MFDDAVHVRWLVLCRSVGGEVTQDGDFLLFEGNRYDRRGFLYKSFVMSAIVSRSFGESPFTAAMDVQL